MNVRESSGESTAPIDLETSGIVTALDLSLSCWKQVRPSEEASTVKATTGPSHIGAVCPFGAPYNEEGHPLTVHRAGSRRV